MPFRPKDRHALTPQGRGRFPGFDVLDEVDRWDDVTTGVVLARLSPTPDLSFFTVAEQPTVSALLDRLLDQDGEPKVPVVQLLDARLAVDETDGWYYEGMPEDQVAWRRSLEGLDDDAKGTFGRRFHQLSWDQQGELVQAVSDAEDFHGMPASRVWSLWTRYACTAFYSHPWAWNEMGFGGPAYPRGYKNAGVDKLEGWEVRDHANSDPVPWGQRVEQVKKAHQANIRSTT